MDKIPGETQELTTTEAFQQILTRAEIPVTVPDDIESLCCGQPWSSKGFPDAYKSMAERTTRSLFRASRMGKIPIVVDTTPCTYSLLHYEHILEDETLAQWMHLNIIDLTEYLQKTVLPKLHLQKIPGTVVCHPTCSTMKMELTGLLESVAAQCAEKVVIPREHSCCGFAGDRGLLQPELTASATRTESAEVAGLHNVQGYYSTSRTCEVGMSHATGHPYSSIIHLVERASCPTEIHG